MTNTLVTEELSRAITDAISPLLDENQELRESNAQIQAMFSAEDKGWIHLLGGGTSDSEYGLDLEEVQAIAAQAATQVAAGSIPKRAADLHFGFVFGNGFEIEGVERDKEASAGRPRREVTFYENTVNQESIFSGAAQHELQYARFTTGNVIVLCDTSKKVVRRLPFAEVTSVMVNPDYAEEVWAYLRKWTVQKTDGKSETKQAWVYTNRFDGRKQKSIKTGDQSIPVMENTVAVDLRANRQVGYTFGIPDAAAGLHWSRAYGEVLRYGQIVNESLAKVVYKVVQKTQKGAANVGVKMGKGGAGQTAVVGEGQDIQLVNQSQTSFNFAAARPLAAMAATAWNVSVVDLLSDSSAAGSSYGAGNLLTAGMQNAMQGMRSEWTQFYTDIFAALGFSRPRVIWPPMEKQDPYRLAQQLVLLSPALKDEEYRAEAMEQLDITGDPRDLPPTLVARSAAAKQASSPDQGTSNGTGGQDSAQKSDLSASGVAENVRHEIEMQNILSEMRDLVTRMPGSNS